MALSKSARINIIQQISSHLENDDWTTVDLTLKQFSLPTSDQWNGGIKSYVIKMIEDVKDTDLIELAEHFGMPTPGSDVMDTTAEEPSCWTEGKLKVFISHLSSKRKKAAELQDSLVQYGMSSFVAHADINPTAEWQIEIESALATCDLLVALFHDKFVESQWCDQEIGYALGRGVPVFAVKYESDPHGFVGRFQAFNGAQKTMPQLSTDIFDAAITHKKLQSKMGGILIDMFVNSGSFQTAKVRVAYLDRLKKWDPSYPKRLEKAVEENGQISGAYGVPSDVERLIKKWQ